MKTAVFALAIFAASLVVGPLTAVQAQTDNMVLNVTTIACNDVDDLRTAQGMTREEQVKFFEYLMHVSFQCNGQVVGTRVLVLQRISGYAYVAIMDHTDFIPGKLRGWVVESVLSPLPQGN